MKNTDYFYNKKYIYHFIDNNMLIYSILYNYMKYYQICYTIWCLVYFKS